MTDYRQSRDADPVLRALVDSQRTARNLEDLDRIMKEIRDYAQSRAKEELYDMRAALPVEPVVIVDGKKGKPIEQAQTFGTIVIVAPYGPVQEAVDLAESHVTQQCGKFAHPTGFYARQFRWLMNGSPVGDRAPKVERMGKMGNVQLMNVAGYASMAEIFVADSVIRGAYNLLRKAFGDRLALAFSYETRRASEYGQIWPAGRKSTPFMAVPVLTIGHPAAPFKRISRVPGVRIRQRVRAQRRARQQAPT